MNGSMLSLSCDVIGGLPTPSVTWERNGEVISGENMTGLTFQALVEDDEAEYKCKASNELGNVTSAGITLVIHCKFA